MALGYFCEASANMHRLLGEVVATLLAPSTASLTPPLPSAWPRAYSARREWSGDLAGPGLRAHHPLQASCKSAVPGGRFLIRLCDLVGAPRGHPGPLFGLPDRGGHLGRPATKRGGRGRPAGHAAVPLATGGTTCLLRPRPRPAPLLLLVPSPVALAGYLHRPPAPTRNTQHAVLQLQLAVGR
jgi:hypothetical protein